MQNSFYLMPWQGPNSGATQAIARLCQAVCRFHELMREHGRKIRMFFILSPLSEVVISHVYLTNVDGLT